MSVVLEFLPEATAEVAAAVRYYETRVQGLGVRFRREVESVCGAVVQHPLLWRERFGWLSTRELAGLSILHRILLA